MDTDNLKKHEEELNKLQTLIRKVTSRIEDLKVNVNYLKNTQEETIKK